MFICWCYQTSVSKCCWSRLYTPYYYWENNAVLNKGANCVKRFSIYAINIVQMMVSAIIESKFKGGLIMAGPRPLLWHLKAKQPPEPPRWCTSSARKWLLFLWICCVPLLLFFVYLDECLPFPGLGQKDSETWLLRFSAVFSQWKSLAEVISFVLQPLYNTHNSLSHME